MRRLTIELVAIGSLIMMVAGLAAAQSRKPDAAGVGFSWGHGVLGAEGIRLTLAK